MGSARAGSRYIASNLEALSILVLTFPPFLLILVRVLKRQRELVGSSGGGTSRLCGDRWGLENSLAVELQPIMGA